MSKIPLVNPIFQQINPYIYTKFISEKWVNRRHFFIDEKNLQKLGLAGELISAYLYYMIILSSQSQFMVLQLVK